MLIPSSLILFLQPSGVPVTAFGALCPLLDKTDAVMDLLQEACKEAGLQLGEQINVWINAAADNMFDQVACQSAVFH